MEMKHLYTSTGAKFFHHQEAMNNLRNGRGQCVVTTVMITDICNHTCAFCSVQHRAGDSLVFNDVMSYIDILIKYGLKSVILSGGGNPILYKCKKTSKTFSDVVNALHNKGLEIGLITNGMLMRDYQQSSLCSPRKSWKNVAPSVLDKITWVRISMSGLDHKEGEVYVPDVNPNKTTLGFSYVAHDIYKEAADLKHGKVSRPSDLISGDLKREPDLYFEERISELTWKIGDYVKTYNPKYVRLLPNCLEPSLIDRRCAQLQKMADDIDQSIVFVQNKPPKAPHACYLGYIHPVLAPSGYVMPCDSHCLNENADHKLGGEPWRICHWSEVAKLYEQPIHSLIADPSKTCPGCVFGDSNTLLEGVVNGTIKIIKLDVVPIHHNFV